jgi:hypothetical protein
MQVDLHLGHASIKKGYFLRRFEAPKFPRRFERQDLPPS